MLEEREKIIRCERVRNDVVIYTVKGRQKYPTNNKQKDTIWIGLSCVGTAL